MASIKELLSAMIAKINGKNEGVDWNENDETSPAFVKNRPFYTGDTVVSEIIPEQTYTLTKSGSVSIYEDTTGSYQYSLEEGKNYTVVYNGTLYELTSGTIEGMAYVGDVGPLTTGSDPTIPFLIIAGGGFLQIIDYTGNTKVTFKISCNATEIKQIDTKYIPWKDAIGLKPPVLIRESPSYFTDDEKQMYYDLFKSGSLLVYLADSNYYGIVVSIFYSKTVGFKMAIIDSDGILCRYDGTDWQYSDITKDGIKSTINDILKNTTYWQLLATSYSSVSVGDPFNAAIKWNSSTGKACIRKNMRSTYGTIMQENDIVCSGDKEIVLSSSTADSTKKYRITVDDTGTLSATEVTE